MQGRVANNCIQLTSIKKRVRAVLSWSIVVVVVSGEAVNFLIHQVIKDECQPLTATRSQSENPFKCWGNFWLNVSWLGRNRQIGYSSKAVKK